MTATRNSLRICPLTYRKACAFVDANHRHHSRPQGQIFALGCLSVGDLVGVLIAGRPVSRVNDDGLTLEVTRCCTLGVFNTCSKLYAAAVRIARIMGYVKVITYILDVEHGSSLKASGFKIDLLNAGGGSWNSQSRKRTRKAPECKKQRWSIILSGTQS